MITHVILLQPKPKTRIDEINGALKQVQAF